MTRTLAILIALALPANAKDASRVPAHGSDYHTIKTVFVRTCEIRRVKFKRHAAKRNTTVAPTAETCITIIREMMIEQRKPMIGIFARMKSFEPFRLECRQ